jgi:hypothetical protein
VRIGQIGRLDVSPDLIEASHPDQNPDMLVLWGCHERSEEMDNGLGLAHSRVEAGEIVHWGASFVGHPDQAIDYILQGLTQSRAWVVTVGSEELPQGRQRLTLEIDRRQCY